MDLFIFGVYLITLNRLGVSSSIGKSKVECRKGKRTLLSLTMYSQAMGKGTIMQDLTLDSSRIIPPKTELYEIMKFACDNAR